MNTFIDNVNNQKTTTENGMKARISTTNSNVDLFFKIGSSRGSDITKEFVAAMVENEDLAIRILLYSRDILEGLGERQTFKNILNLMELHYSDELEKIIHKIPEIGRWDDGFCFKTKKFKNIYFKLIKQEIENNKNSLVFKWLPRCKNYKKKNNGNVTDKQRQRINLVNNLVKYLNLTKEEYRKLCSSNTDVVEQKMCSNQWDDINFSHVPSIASCIYKESFGRHTEKYKEYLEKLSIGDSSVKINAKAIFPHQILGNIEHLVNLHRTESITDEVVDSLLATIAQWNSLPNYIGEAKVLPMIDVSSSMSDEESRINKTLTCMDVAVSLGLYCADKNKGPFKNTFLTFNTTSELITVQGNIIEKVLMAHSSPWGGSTNIESALEKVLNHAMEFKVKQEDMPEVLLILSDMQFDRACGGNVTAFKLIKKYYKDNGYKMPLIVFWNLNAHDNIPVKFDKEGVALVSGFSINNLKSILSENIVNFTPESVMIETVMKERYDF